MKLSKILISAIALTALSGVAHAQATMDAHIADKTATKVRQVSYQCTTGGKIKVTYGFNKQKLPTYAEANLGGKTRFLPINLDRSDIAGTFFGDENSWQLSTDALTLNNYHKSDLLIHSPEAETAYKNCRVVQVKRIKN